MRVIIAGSRTITDPNLVKIAINESGWKGDIDCVVSGTARGVDKIGEQLADLKGWDKILCPANWEWRKSSAGVVRNILMADIADRLIAVWDGESRGTVHMIESMKKLGKPVFRFNVKTMKGTHFLPEKA